MIKRDICGTEIWECSPEEAKAVWKEQPAERWRIWTHEEIDAHFLDGPDQLAECIRQKKEKPGLLITKG